MQDIGDFSKAELIEFAAAQEIEVDDSKSAKQIRKTIREALAATEPETGPETEPEPEAEPETGTGTEAEAEAEAKPETKPSLPGHATRFDETGNPIFGS